ncbi:MAG: hypothetical protein PVH88_21500 [Ignavibacteria bacterium]
METDIGAVDHKKGHLEKEYALLIGNNSDEKQLNKVKKKIRNTINLHNRYLGKCTEFRDDLITIIDQILIKHKPRNLLRRIVNVGDF